MPSTRRQPCCPRGRPSALSARRLALTGRRHGAVVPDGSRSGTAAHRRGQRPAKARAWIAPGAECLSAAARSRWTTRRLSAAAKPACRPRSDAHRAPAPRALGAAARLPEMGCLPGKAGHSRRWPGVGTATIEGAAGATCSTASGGRAAGLATATGLERLGDPTKLGHHRRQPDQNQASGQPGGARQDKRGAKSELIDWNTESDCRDTRRGKHDTQQRQNHRHIVQVPARTGYPRQSHGAMVTKEFYARSGSTAITNVSGMGPNSILLNTPGPLARPRH